MHSLANWCHQWGTKLKENSCIDYPAVCSAMNTIGNYFLPLFLSRLLPHHQFIGQHALPWLKTSYFLRVECFNMSIYVHILKTLRIFISSNKMRRELQRTLKPSLTQACHLAREPWSEESLLPGLPFIPQGVFMTNRNILWPSTDNLRNQNNKSSGFAIV